VPQVFAGVGVERNDRGKVEVVAAGRAAQVAVPRRAVAGAEIDGVEVGVEGDAVPHRAAAAVHPVVAGGVPGLGGRRHGLVLVGFARIARDHEPAPSLTAGLGVVGGDVAAHAILGAAVADDHLAVGHARRAGDRVGMLVVDDGVFFPNLPAARRVEGDQPPVIGADEDLALVQGDAPVHDVTAAAVTLVARDLGVEGPDLLAGAGIDGVDDAPRRRDIHDAVDHDRGRLDAARRVEVVGPREAEVLDVAGVDLVELAEAGLAEIETDGRPVLRRRCIVLDPGAVDGGGDGLDVGRRPLGILCHDAGRERQPGDDCGN
jgi:hypothetical protein